MSSIFDRESPFLPSKTTDRLPMMVDDFYRWPIDANDLLSLSSEGREVYKDLLRSLKRKTGFGLFFAVQPIPAKVDRIIQSLEKDLPLKKIAVLELDRDAKTMFDRVDQIYAENHFDILCIKGIENALYDYEDTQRLSGWTTEEVYSYSWKGVPPILNHLNQQRDRFSTEFPSSSFVFFLPSFAVDYFIQRAPDFFDWRSGFFEFPTNKQELADKLNEVATGNLDSYIELTKEERIRKSLELKELLQPNIDLTTAAKLHLEIALVFLSNGHFLKALTSLEQCIELSQDRYKQYTLLINYGNVLGLLERYENALASYDRAIGINPNNSLAWFYRGLTLANLEQNEESLASLDKAITLNSDEYRVWSLRGNILDSLERYEEALASFDRAVEINPDDYEIEINRGNILIKLERYEEALASYNRAIEITPNNYGIWVNRSNILNNLERYEEALASYNRAIEITPDGYLAWFNRGSPLANLERYEEALASYNRAIEINPDNYIAWFQRGNVLKNLEHYEEALASYSRAIEINPDNYGTWVNRSNILNDLERYEEALASYNRAIEINPEEDIAWFNHAVALANLGMYKEALASFDRAVEIDPDEYESWFQRSKVLYDLERYEEALASLNKVIEIEPGFAQAYISISRVQYMQGNLDLAIVVLTKAIKYKLINDPNAWNNIGFIYLVKNKLYESIKYFRSSLQKRQNQFYPIFNLALVHTRQKHLKLAKQLIEQSLTFSKDSNSQERLYTAIGKIALGQEQEGLETIQEILANSQNLRLQNLLRGGIIESAEILARSNYFPGTEKALHMFQAALDQNADRV